LLNSEINAATKATRLWYALAALAAPAVWTALSLVYGPVSLSVAVLLGCIWIVAAIAAWALLYRGRPKVNGG